MKNRCLVHNAQAGIDHGIYSSLAKYLPSSATKINGSVSIENGTTAVTITGDEFRELTSAGFCSSEHAVIDQQRAFISVPQMPFSGNLCDAVWYGTKAHFDNEQTLDCDVLQGCTEHGVVGTCGKPTLCKGGVSCRLDYAKMNADIGIYPLWAQMLHSYATVAGRLAFKNELSKLYSQIESSTGARNSWMLQMAKELIESRMESNVEESSAKVLEALQREAMQIIRNRREIMKGGAVVSGGQGTRKPAAGLAS